MFIKNINEYFFSKSHRCRYTCKTIQKVVKNALSTVPHSWRGNVGFITFSLSQKRWLLEKSIEPFFILSFSFL